MFRKANAEFLQCAPWEAIIIQIFQGLDKIKDGVRGTTKVHSSSSYTVFHFVQDTGRHEPASQGLHIKKFPRLLSGTFRMRPRRTPCEESFPDKRHKPDSQVCT